MTGQRSRRSLQALSSRARLLDVHADADHNRSVFTLVGEEDELADALVAAVGLARERIDLAATRAPIRGSAPPTSSRSSRSSPMRWSARGRPRW